MKAAALVLAALLVACLSGRGAEAGCKPSFTEWGNYQGVTRGDTIRKSCFNGCIITDRRADQSLTTLWGGDGTATLPGACVISIYEGGGTSNICTLRTGSTTSLGPIKYKTIGNCRVDCLNGGAKEMRCCASGDSSDCYVNT